MGSYDIYILEISVVPKEVERQTFLLRGLQLSKFEI